jgi:phage terminase large subunit-like protein
MRLDPTDTNMKDVRELAEANLGVFAHLVNPLRVYGDVHRDVFEWWMDCEKRGVDNTALLLPRDHQKSHCAAVKAAWLITRDPSKTLLYVSATSALAEKQLKAIKDILTSDVYRRYWPEMIHPEEGKREKWTTTEICVDHPIRKREAVRDSTVFAAGLTTNITGFHATDVFLDDVVVPNNAYTEEGRLKVSQQYSQLASIETTGATETVVGTRYHPADIYNSLLNMKETVFNEEGDVVGERDVYEFKIEVVEVDGEFLWPKEVRADGKTFGFDHKELARKKAKYLDQTQFYAQYYNDPNDPESRRLSYDRFQYYDKRHLRQEYGKWYFKDKPLNIYAGIDFAFSLNKKADYTAIVVIGVDSDGVIYVMDIDRFKCDKISEYFDRLVRLHTAWDFKKLRAEVTVAQKVICNDLKDRIRTEGLRLSIDEHRPSRHQGSKEERIVATLEPRYDNQTILHYKGGYTPVLEEELVLARPPHDDIKDCLASVVEIAVPPKSRRGREKKNVITFNKRFGGVSI